MDKWLSIYISDDDAHPDRHLYRTLTEYFGPRDYSISAAQCRWLIKYNVTYHNQNYIRIKFKFKKDAVLFKLIWA